MADYTVTTNAKQEEALAFLLQKVNQDRQQPLSAAEVVQKEFREFTVSRWLEEFRAFRRQEIGDLYVDGTAQQRSQVDAILKG